MPASSRQYWENLSVHSIRERSQACDALRLDAASWVSDNQSSAVAAHRIVDSQRRRGRALVSKMARDGQPERAEVGELGSIDEDLARAEEAYQLMLVADTCLRSGADRLLLLLGFSQPHVDELRASAGTGGGYPAYALRSIRRTLRVLRKSRDTASGLVLGAECMAVREGKCSS